MASKAITDGRVLIVDDHQPNVLLLKKILRRAGYTNVRGTTESAAVLPLYSEFQPDILLLDLHMPQPTGFEVLDQLAEVIPSDTYFPILVVTADATVKAKKQALARGAKDFLTKPFDQVEVLLRIQNLLESRFLHVELQAQNRVLEKLVEERTRDLEDARLEVLERLSLAAEFRDDTTGKHTQRVGQTSALLAQAFGLPDEQVELIRRAAPLHDVGKIGIADSILLKPGRLEPSEFQIMKTHTSIGGHILSGSRSVLLQVAEQISLTHHECWNGSGYPQGLRETQIPLVGRLVSVADMFDALTHERPYKPAWSIDEAVQEIDRASGTKFDPNVVEKFRSLLQQGLIGKAEQDAPSEMSSETV